ncbi:MAG: PD-(D/E)XK nuclease family protein, partial [Bacteroidales bacterium]|nr:PD-(D/E)XK nuclease family protein [Bacteroidales bacterium]
KRKTKEVMDLLMEKAKQGHGLTPSSLNIFRKCSLHYYYENILGIRVSDELEEDRDSSELGSYIHQVLEEIFKPFIKKEIDANQLPDDANVEALIEQIFDEEVFKKTAKRTGENYFLMEIAKTQVKTFIRQQKEELKNHNSSIVDLEKDLTTEIPLSEIFGDRTPNNLKTITIKPHGVADRIETANGVPRIGDYKSGTVKKADLILEFEQFNTDEQQYSPEKISDKMFQVLYYAWLYWRTNKPQRIEAGIYPLQDTKNFFIQARIKAQERGGDDTISFSDTHMQLFEKYVISLFADLFDQNVDFVQNPTNDNCKYCTFANLCSIDKR